MTNMGQSGSCSWDAVDTTDSPVNIHAKPTDTGPDYVHVQAVSVTTTRFWSRSLFAEIRNLS